MQTIRIFTFRGPNSPQFALSLEAGSKTLVSRGAYTPIDFDSLSQVRWYMERFLDEQDAAGIARASQVDRWLRDAGIRLFREIFDNSIDSQAIWKRVKERLGETRVEIADESGMAMIWEILRVPETMLPLCLTVNSFVRSDIETTNGPTIEKARINMLLVISRAAGAEDISYRTIAATIYSNLQSRTSIKVNVLRPPTFSQLHDALRQADEMGEPYDLVHFDGHGFQDVCVQGDDAESLEEAVLEFEDEANGREYIGAVQFSALLANAGVSYVVLNACRSAAPASDAENSPSAAIPTDSVSGALLKAGIHGVVAMSFNVYAASAKLYMGEFYRQLAAGSPFSVAASSARQLLASEQTRFDHDSSSIDDWIVPAVFLRVADLRLDATAQSASAPSVFDQSGFPPPPMFGFVGGDDSLLQIDRAFDRDPLVLLYGLAGAGKSSTAVEFARWYLASNPSIKRVLFSSFEDTPSLGDVLSEAASRLSVEATATTMMDPGYQAQFASFLAQQGTLWVWDNVETIDTYPAAAKSQITEFLHLSERASLKILFTSRDALQQWLPSSTVQVEMFPLRESESIELVRIIMHSRSIRNFIYQAVAPVIDFAEGNPLTLLLAISSYLAVCDSPSEDAAHDYVASLDLGTATLADLVSNDRSRSLTASLHYGLDKMFTKGDQDFMSLLSLFRTYANSGVLLAMCQTNFDSEQLGLPEHDFSWGLAEFASFSGRFIEQLLDRAVSLGLLRKSHERNFWLHPAVHIYLRYRLDRLYPTDSSMSRPQRAFCEAVAIFCMQFSRGLQDGNRMAAMEAFYKERDNVLFGLELAHENGWLQAEAGLLEALFAILDHEGRKVEWRERFLRYASDFLDENFGAKPGAERWWSFFADKRLLIATEDRDLMTAESLARRILEAEESGIAPIPRTSGTLYDSREKTMLMNYAITLGRLADVLRDKGDPACITYSKEAIKFYDLIGNGPAKAKRLFNMGHAYKNVPRLRNLETARVCYTDSLAAVPEQDNLARAQGHAQLSLVLSELFEEERRYAAPAPLKVFGYLKEAIVNCKTALNLFPEQAAGELSKVHNQMGSLLRHIGDEEDVLKHFRESIRLSLMIANHRQATFTKTNLAHVLDSYGRRTEAVAMASEAQSELERIGYKGPEATEMKRIIRQYK